MTSEHIIAELTASDEHVLHHDFPDQGAFVKPRPFGWRSIVLTFVWCIPVWFLFKVFDERDFWFSLVVVYLTTIFMDWRAYKSITRNENYRNLIVTDKRVIQISRVLNFDDSLRLRYVDPSNFTGVEDRFTDSTWWAAATTRDADQPILIASRKTELVKALIQRHFLNAST